ncbi:replication protein [uncultured marine virus]|nr:replication protein [uncultured marine virus]
MKKKIIDASRNRAFCFTYYPKDEKRDLIWFVDLSKKSGISYMVMGREHCPTTQRLHFQGYIHFKNAKTLKATRRWFGLDRISLFIAKGNDIQNEEYCSKENKVLEVGKPIKQGKRNDITRAIEIINSTGKMSEVLNEVHNYQACRHAELYLKYCDKNPIRHDLQVINYWGETNQGKTYKVYDENEEVYRPINYKWWDGYDGQEVVILDDIRKDFCKFHELLNLLDIYPLRVEFKGGSRQLKAKKIYITTPIPLVDMWSNRCCEDVEQLARRITHTEEITRKK